MYKYATISPRFRRTDSQASVEPPPRSEFGWLRGFPSINAMVIALATYSFSSGLGLDIEDEKHVETDRQGHANEFDE